MTVSLHTVIRNLAQEFANAVLEAVRSAPLEDLATVAETESAAQEYGRLTDGEIRKLKANGHDPHDLKPKKHASRYDLYKRRRTGKVFVGPKHLPYRTAPDEDTCININDLPRKEKRRFESTEESVEFRITGSANSARDVVQRLNIGGAYYWDKGDKRGTSKILEHAENGIAIRAGRLASPLHERVEQLLERVRRHERLLDGPSGTRELVCVLYVPPTERPAMHFTKEAIRHMSNLGAALDVDLYEVGGSY